MNWIYRGGRADLVPEDRAGDHAPLIEAVKDAHWLPGQVHVFIHGEAQAVMHNLRPYIRKERGVDAKWASSISGYWRRGRTEETFRQWKKELAEAEAGPNSSPDRRPGMLCRMAFGDYQHEIYFQGLSGVVPPLPMAFAELEAKAENGDAAVGVVLRRRAEPATNAPSGPTATAFDRWGLMPRMFVGANERDLSVELFGLTLAVAGCSWRRSASSGCAPRTATATWPPRARPPAPACRWSLRR